MFTKKKDGNGADGGAMKPAHPDNGQESAPLKASARKGPAIPVRPPAKPGVYFESSNRPVSIPAGPGRTSAADEKKLIVGRDIRLNGEVTACDCLVVEGHAELSLTGAKRIEVGSTGVFVGSVDVQDADIAGAVEGELVVRKRLTVRPTARIRGRIRYQTIVVEAGGRIDGEVGTLEDEGAEGPVERRPGQLQAAAADSRRSAETGTAAAAPAIRNTVVAREA